MRHVVVGFILVILGIWGIVSHWYQFLDLLWVIIPMIMFLCGIFLTLAGVGGLGRRA